MRRRFLASLAVLPVPFLAVCALAGPLQAQVCEFAQARLPPVGANQGWAVAAALERQADAGFVEAAALVLLLAALLLVANRRLAAARRLARDSEAKLAAILDNVGA